MTRASIIVASRDPTPAEQVGSLGDIGARLDLALGLADLAISLVEQSIDAPLYDTDRLREMLRKLKNH